MYFIRGVVVRFSVLPGHSQGVQQFPFPMGINKVAKDLVFLMFWVKVFECDLSRVYPTSRPKRQNRLQHPHDPYEDPYNECMSF